MALLPARPPRSPIYARQMGRSTASMNARSPSHGLVIPRRYPMRSQCFILSCNSETGDSGMTVRSTAVAIATAAGLLLGHGPASAAAPKHVILIMMENHGTDTLFGNKEDAPFINALITDPGVRYATQYYGVTHPSLPNYLALVAGDEMGIHDDCKAGADVKCKPEEFVPDTDEPATAGRLLTDEQEKQAAETAHLFPGKTLIDQLDEAKISWKVYMQGLPADRKSVEFAPLDANGKVVAKLYAQKHNP